MFEIRGEDDVPPPVRQPVGMECDQGAAEDREQAEADPERDEHENVGPLYRSTFAPGLRERINNPAKQYRFGELGARQGDIRDCENGPKPAFRTEQRKDAGVNLEDAHYQPTKNFYSIMLSTLRPWTKVE